LIHARVSTELTFLEDTRCKKILERLAQTATSKGPHRGQGSGLISRAADTTPKFIEIQLPENGNQRVSGSPASRQPIDVFAVNPSQAAEKQTWQSLPGG
jgi:hypothetical protein